MDKYIAIFKISFAQEFVYKLNFLMWRLRNVMQVFLVFFLWDAIFSDPRSSVFGYNRSTILTYVFGLIIVRSVVLSARSVDVAGEVSRGDLSNYLIKPISYFKYWLTRDLSSKTLNLLFAVFEASVLMVILKPPFYLQTHFVQLLLFALAIFIAILLFFLLMFLFSLFPLWYPEQAWGASFLLFIFVDFLGGGICRQGFHRWFFPAGHAAVLFWRHDHFYDYYSSPGSVAGRTNSYRPICRGVFVKAGQRFLGKASSRNKNNWFRE